MTLHSLIPHPANASTAITEILAIARRRGSRVSFAFRPLGDRAQIRWPVPLPMGFSDELWRHSCFEAFIGGVGDPAYVELNMATSRRWAAYRFDGYRAGMRVADAAAERVRWLPAANATLRASFDVPGLPADRDWQLGLSAVIELIDGTRHYFALSHGPGNPDFHDRDCWTAVLPVSTAL